jgi:hypothetical protein
VEGQVKYFQFGLFFGLFFIPSYVQEDNLLYMIKLGKVALDNPRTCSFMLEEGKDSQTISFTRANNKAISLSISSQRSEDRISIVGGRTHSGTLASTKAFSKELGALEAFQIALSALPGFRGRHGTYRVDVSVRGNFRIVAMERIPEMPGGDRLVMITDRGVIYRIIEGK